MFVITLPILEKILRQSSFIFPGGDAASLREARGALVQLNPSICRLLTLSNTVQNAIIGMIIRSREGCWERLPCWR